MTMRVAAALAVGLIAGGGFAAAQGQAPAEVRPQAPQERGPQAVQEPAALPGGEQRYTFHRKGDGFVRLDSQTGQVAQCSWSAAAWTCIVAPDERSALEAEMARVRTENAALKKELLARGLELPAGVRPEPPQAKAPDAQSDPRTDPKLPVEAEIDRAFNFMKGVWRRLIEMMAELHRDIQKKS